MRAVIQRVRKASVTVDGREVATIGPGLVALVGFSNQEQLNEAAASLEKGNRPSFHTAAAPETARRLFAAFVESARRIYPQVSTGAFQAHMVVSLENDGPVTFILCSD